jgi:hypothetical protein
MGEAMTDVLQQEIILLQRKVIALSDELASCREELVILRDFMNTCDRICGYPPPKRKRRKP